jgi:hypothetical protein
LADILRVYALFSPVLLDGESVIPQPLVHTLITDNYILCFGCHLRLFCVSPLFPRLKQIIFPATPNFPLFPLCPAFELPVAVAQPPFSASSAATLLTLW